MKNAETNGSTDDTDGTARLLEMQRRNMAALSRAANLAAGSTQRLIGWQSGAMEKAYGKFLGTLSETAEPKSPQDLVARHLEQLKAGLEQAAEQSRELSGLMLQAQAEAIGIVTACLIENIDQFAHVMRAFSGGNGIAKR